MFLDSVEKRTTQVAEDLRAEKTNPLVPTEVVLRYSNPTSPSTAPYAWPSDG